MLVSSLPLLLPPPPQHILAPSNPSNSSSSNAGNSETNQHPHHHHRNRRNDPNKPQTFHSSLHKPNSLSLVALAQSEDLISHRKNAIATFGYSWIKPAGCAKTMLGRREEELEREEVERQIREAEEAEMRDEGGLGAETFGEEGMTGEEEAQRDLDEDVPEAPDQTNLDDDDEDDGVEEEAGFIPTAVMGEGDTELSGMAQGMLNEDELMMGGDLDGDIPSAEQTRLDAYDDGDDDEEEEGGEWQHTDTEEEIIDDDSEIHLQSHHHHQHPSHQLPSSSLSRPSQSRFRPQQHSTPSLPPPQPAFNPEDSEMMDLSTLTAETDSSDWIPPLHSTNNARSTQSTRAPPHRIISGNAFSNLPTPSFPFSFPSSSSSQQPAATAPPTATTTPPPQQQTNTTPATNAHRSATSSHRRSWFSRVATPSTSTANAGGNPNADGQQQQQQQQQQGRGMRRNLFGRTTGGSGGGGGRGEGGGGLFS